MAKAKGPKRGKATGVETPRPALLARAPDPSPKPTLEALASIVDELVDTLNLRVKKADLECEEAADLLFRRVFENKSTTALDPKTRRNPLYKLLLARAGHSLQLEADELRQYAIIGALNHRIPETGWRPLGWTMKCVLVSLVEPKDTKLLKLRRGIEFAARTGTSLNELRDWKRAEFPQLEGTPGRPREFTLPAGQKLVQGGVRLGNARERQAFAEKVKDAPPATKKAFAKDLDKTIENLMKLRDEIGE